MRITIVFCLTLLVSFSCFANKKKASGVLADANKMAKAFVSRDYITYAKYSYYQHPGPEEEQKLAVMVTQHMYDLEKQNNIITGMTLGTPTATVHTDKQLQCIVPVTMKMHIKGGTVITHTNMIAFSNDKGHSWHFMDMGGKALETLRKQYPEISPTLTVPATPEETFQPDSQ